MAFTGALDLSPYLRVLPADLTCFRPLLSALGVRETFAPRDYVGVMRRLASDHEKEGGEGGEGGGAPVRGKALDVALWVLGALADTACDAPCRERAEDWFEQALNNRGVASIQDVVRLGYADELVGAMAAPAAADEIRARLSRVDTTLAPVHDEL